MIKITISLMIKIQSVLTCSIMSYHSETQLYEDMTVEISTIKFNRVGQVFCSEGLNISLYDFDIDVETSNDLILFKPEIAFHEDRICKSDPRFDFLDQGFSMTQNDSRLTFKIVDTVPGVHFCWNMLSPIKVLKTYEISLTEIDRYNLIQTYSISPTLIMNYDNETTITKSLNKMTHVHAGVILIPNKATKSLNSFIYNRGDEYGNADMIISMSYGTCGWLAKMGSHWLMNDFIRECLINNVRSDEKPAQNTVPLSKYDVVGSPDVVIDLSTPKSSIYKEDYSNCTCAVVCGLTCNVTVVGFNGKFNIGSQSFRKSPVSTELVINNIFCNGLVIKCSVKKVVNLSVAHFKFMNSNIHYDDACLFIANHIILTIVTIAVILMLIMK
ncbi:hypothetical protein [Ramu stunt virus]|uniref:Uncharacterized protein n=1 Tax=Ramu stunt virus TaxID=1738604 RepID=A0A0P0H2H1_9VIRU|nr:hypothetical protein [Ramu stunt virus]